MQRNHFAAQFAALAEEDRSRFLTRFGRELTLAVRDIYGATSYRTPIRLSAGEESGGSAYSTETKLAFASGAAEMNHQIFGYLLASEESERYPADVFVEVLCDIAEGHGMQAAFPEWWRRAWSATV